MAYWCTMAYNKNISVGNTRYKNSLDTIDTETRSFFAKSDTNWV